MSLYLTRTEHKNGYINLRPIFEFTQSGPLEVDRFEKFPPRGLLQVKGAQNVENRLLNTHAYSLLELSDSLLSGLEQKEDGTKKIYISDFINNAKTIDSDYRIKEVIDIPINFNFEKISEWESLTDILKPFTRNIYLSNSTFVAGPFSWNEDGIGYKFSPSITSGDLAYMVNVYDINDLKIEPDIYDFDASKNLEDINEYGRNRHLLFGSEETLPAPKKQVDCMSDKELKTIIGRILSQNLINRSEKQKLKNLIADLPESEITSDRKGRIEELLKKRDEIDDFVSSIPAIILDNKESADKIAQTIFDNENYKNDERLTEYVKKLSGYNVELERLNEEKRKLENDLTNKKNELSEINKKETPSLSKKERSELEQKINACEKINIQLQNDLQKANKELGDFKSIKDSIENLKIEKIKLEGSVEEKKEAIKSLKSEAEKKMKNAYKDLFSHNFDEELAGIIMQEHLNHKSKEQNDELSKTFNLCRANLVLSDKTDLTDLIEFIHNELKFNANREVEKNEIVNILLCLSQGFITIFAGEPGTGKTSLVNLIARILGLNNDTYNRYLQISVEKGWTSKRDLIGYYNPLSKTFETSDKRLLSSLQMLNLESENNCSDLPFLVLLDEANLSQMEYYWADFMTLCDSDNPNQFISLSENLTLKIPPTLRFVATINLDNTTEALSPRLIDRAWIITLKSYDIDFDDFSIANEKVEKPSSDLAYPTISMDILRPFFDSNEWKNKKLNDGILDKFKKVTDIFREINVKFSPRIIGMIKKYCLAGEQYFEKSNIYAPLDYAVSQKILPKINGYGDDL